MQVLDFLSSSCLSFRAQGEVRRPPEDAVLRQAVRDRTLPAEYEDRPRKHQSSPNPPTPPWHHTR